VIKECVDACHALVAMLGKQGACFTSTKVLAFTCFTNTKVLALLALLVQKYLLYFIYSYKSARFTCFISTKARATRVWRCWASKVLALLVQKILALSSTKVLEILTPEALRARSSSTSCVSLLALLVQTYQSLHLRRCVPGAPPLPASFYLLY
jgi:hypothetical protein